MQISNIRAWPKKRSLTCFSIKLPSGWPRRSFDNQHRLEDYKIDKDKIWLKFDEGGNHLLKFNSYSTIELLWFSYDKTINEKSTNIFNEGELIIYGYFK